MLYCFGVGEVAISIVPDHDNPEFFYHTIRCVGRVTETLNLLQVGDTVGLRGPFGHGWPLQQAQNKDVLVITGGLGCAPSVSAINAIFADRNNYGKLTILQGVKHSDDLIFKQQYDQWAAEPNTQVLLAADVSAPNWPGYTGLITELIDRLKIDVNNTLCMMCGPEGMMGAAIVRLHRLGLREQAIYVNLERNMECAIGLCGHCQFGGEFICKNGPVFCYPKVKHLFGRIGF